MTSDDSGHQSQSPQISNTPQTRGGGCVLGGLVVIGSAALGWVLSGLLVTIIPDTAEHWFFVLASALSIGILVAAGMYLRRIPGFLLGIGLTIAVQILIFTGLAAIVFVVRA